MFCTIGSHYKKIGCKVNVLRQTTTLVVNPIITVDNIAFHFNCSYMDWTSHSMTITVSMWYFLCGSFLLFMFHFYLCYAVICTFSKQTLNESLQICNRSEFFFNLFFVVFVFYSIKISKLAPSGVMLKNGHEASMIDR